jgi:hypothetical protein
MAASANILTTGWTPLYIVSISEGIFPGSNSGEDILIRIAGNATDLLAFGPLTILQSGCDNFSGMGNGVDKCPVTPVWGADDVLASLFAGDPAGSLESGYDTPAVTESSVTWIRAAVQAGFNTLELDSLGGFGVPGAAYGFTVEARDWLYSGGEAEFPAFADSYNGGSSITLDVVLHGDPVSKPSPPAPSGAAPGASTAKQTPVLATPRAAAHVF